MERVLLAVRPRDGVNLGGLWDREQHDHCAGRAASPKHKAIVWSVDGVENQNGAKSSHHLGSHIPVYSVDTVEGLFHVW